MTRPGPLIGADEQLTHQIVDTFARVGQSDRSWTEKVWAFAAARDGSLAMSFGLGKYVNRDVMDGYAGIARGTEQWTVRASRQLSPEPEACVVGPITYDIVEPMSRIRFRLAENDIVPICFDVELRSEVPPALEEREVHVSRSGFRVDADILRFHQAGVASGWVEVEGVRAEFDESSWVGSRDRSWGVRYNVGQPVTDVYVAPKPSDSDMSGMFLYMPITMADSQGRPFTLFVYYQNYRAPGWSRATARGAFEFPDGRVEPFRDVVPEFSFRDDNRRFLGGTLRVVLADGRECSYRVEPLSDTGYHLGTGLYGGFEGHYQGEWRGELHVEGEHVTGCDRPEVARRVRQHRDCVVRIEDLTGGSTGVGTVQSGVYGAHPDMGLTAEASFY